MWTKKFIKLIFLKRFVNLETEYSDIWFGTALSADTGEDKGGSVMTKPVCLITDTPTTLLNVGNYVYCQKVLSETTSLNR